ncbi:MAG: DHH family phosphoesterase [Spirochaetaceae bacterium]|jgi:nanoRNase/pAp phosphatase (c-di-AMP/oligoRNAs hydrolase)|nr:DHH family phosphoesterase [Spirochaetaceae bacterium]
MLKTEIKTIAEKKRITANIIAELSQRDAFVLVGHKDPDTDCIAALAALALIIRKLQKDAVIFLPSPVMEQFNYLLAICKYNGITVLYGNDEIPDDISGVVILDTPKPEMIAMNNAIAGFLKNPGIRKIEIDHHLQSDAEYTGDPGYCLVSEASSTCELIGYLTFKLARQAKDSGDVDFFSRNIALAILTGIVGDSHMGKYLKSNKERFYYKIFSAMFDKLLIEKTIKNSRNISSMQAIFDAIERFSVQEKKCFDGIIKKRQKAGVVFYVALEKDESAGLFSQYGAELIVNVSKAVADTLAEESGKLGLIAYYDPEFRSDFIQFRLRRSSKYKTLDLRVVLTSLGISNGGGHPGAIGFRVKQSEVADMNAYVNDLVAKIDQLAAADT